jgi:transcriptional regulator with XRE-family HTH domain
VASRRVDGSRRPGARLSNARETCYHSICAPEPSPETISQKLVSPDLPTETQSVGCFSDLPRLVPPDVPTQTGVVRSPDRLAGVVAHTCRGGDLARDSRVLTPLNREPDGNPGLRNRLQPGGPGEGALDDRLGRTYFQLKLENGSKGGNMKTVPWWVVNVEPEDWGKLGAVIKEFFSDLPMAQSQLASTLKVDQTAISRWALGKTKPTLQEFSKAVGAIENRLAELMKRVTMYKQLVGAMQKAGAAAGAGGLRGIQKARAARSGVHEALEQFSERKSDKRKSTKSKGQR